MGICFLMGIELYGWCIAQSSLYTVFGTVAS